MLSEFLILLGKLPAFIFKRKITYLFSPDSVLGEHIKHRIFVLSNLFPSIFGSGYLIANLREFIKYNKRISQYENLSIVIGLIVFLLLLYITGIITEKIIYSSNDSYKDWKNQQSTSVK
jgi:hypothetical protein